MKAARLDINDVQPHNSRAPRVDCIERRPEVGNHLPGTVVLLHLSLKIGSRFTSYSTTWHPRLTFATVRDPLRASLLWLCASVGQWSSAIVVHNLRCKSGNSRVWSVNSSCRYSTASFLGDCLAPRPTSTCLY